MDPKRLPRALRTYYLKNKGLFSNVKPKTSRRKTGGKEVLSAALVHTLSKLSNTSPDVRVTLAEDLWTTSRHDLTFQFSNGTWTSSGGLLVSPEVLLNSIEETVLAGRAKRIDLFVDVSENVDGRTFREIMEAIDELKTDLRVRYDPTDDNASRYRTPYQDVQVSLGIVLSFHGDTTDYTEDFLFHVIPASHSSE